MAIKMFNFDNCDIDQMSSKFAQRIVCTYYYKKISILDSLDNAENVKRQFFFVTQYIHVLSLI